MTNSFEIINVSNILFEVLIFCNAKFLNCSKVVRKKGNFNRSIFSLLSNDRLNFSVLIQTGPKPNFCRCKGGSFFFGGFYFFIIRLVAFLGIIFHGEIGRNCLANIDNIVARFKNRSLETLWIYNVTL